MWEIKNLVDVIELADSNRRMKCNRSQMMILAVVLAALLGVGKARAACDTDPGNPPPPGQFE